MSEIVHFEQIRIGKKLTVRGGLRVLILDGHEMTSSYLRCCGDCLTREITCNDETRTQYYHRYVMAYLLCEEGRVLLDVELQRKGASLLSPPKSRCSPSATVGHLGGLS